MEQIRLIEEMRENDRANGRTGVDVRPRYMVWENVPGAFSTNQGQDFAAVLEEAIRVAEPEAPNVSVPEKGWPTAGCVVGDTWSIAWRVLDAQFWGVPQRRRRIALVADFGGRSAPEILFIRKGVSRNLDESEQKRKATAGDAGESSCGAVKSVGFPLGFRPENVRCYDETATTLCNGTRPGFTTGVIQEKPVIAVDQGGDKSGANHYEDISPTLTCTHGGEPAVHYCIEMTSTKNAIVEDGICPTLTARMGTGGNQVNAVIEPMQTYQQVTGPLMANSHPGSYTGQYAYSDMLVAGPVAVQVRYIVRRLTPLECERLQGFPDGWTDIGEWVDSKGKKHKEADSPRYKALGNSIAIPPWKWVLKRLCACYERDATMASLFDGIGGFPYIWEQLNGKGSCLWASEIEEFPMAVTKLRFGGGENG